MSEPEPQTIELSVRAVERLHTKAQRIRRTYALYGEHAIRQIEAVVLADDFHALVKRHLKEAGRL